MKELKFLYETTLLKSVDEPVIEIKEEQGQKIEIKRTVKKAKPVKIAIAKPDRKLFKGAEIFYSKTLSHYLKEGLLPYSLVAKRYANDGGPLTEKEKARLKELREQSLKLENDFFAIKGGSPEEQQEKNQLLISINRNNAEISTIQNAYADIFDSTAEIKSRNDTIEWWSLFLIYADFDGTGYKLVCGDGTYEEKLVRIEALEEEANPLIIETIKRLSYLISFWFTARDTVSTIDFKTMERLYTDTMTDYKVEVGEDTKISELNDTTAATSSAAP